MNRTLNLWMRKLHRHGSIVVALPLLLIICSGILLQFKKESDWVQPPTERGAGGPPAVAFAEILAAARAVPEAEISGWNDIDRLDVRPERGVVKVRAKSGIEVQVDSVNAEVLQVQLRRSDLIESLHDGSWFFGGAKLWIFFPCALILLFLLLSGLYLWLLPLLFGRARSRRAA